MGRYTVSVCRWRQSEYAAQRHPTVVLSLCSYLASRIMRIESNIVQRLLRNHRDTERSFGLWSPSRCDVYIASFGPGQLDLRLELVGQLWRAGVNADLQYDDDRALDDVMKDCSDQNVL